MKVIGSEAIGSGVRPAMVERLLATAMVVLASGPAWAAGDAAQGKTAAERWCASCHAVGPGGRGSDAAPSFAAIGQRRDDVFLRGFLSNPHPPMPRVELSRRDIDDLVAYIVSLGK